jgi:hypothetical protein
MELFTSATKTSSRLFLSPLYFMHVKDSNILDSSPDNSLHKATVNFKGLSHELDLAFDDING